MPKTILQEHIFQDRSTLAPPKTDCPQTDDMGTHDLWLHYHEKTLYRIEVPYLHVSVHTQITCPAKTIQCYGTKTICEPSGLLLIPSNCTEIKALAHHNVLPSLMKNYTTQHSQQTIVSRFVTETSDITAEKLRNLTSNIHFVECQLQSLLTTLFSVMAKQYPGETLSSLTGRKRAAITAGDVLTEIHCQPLQGIVLHSLVYNNTFSSRPLVEFLVNDTRKVGQIWFLLHTYGPTAFCTKAFVLENTFQEKWSPSALNKHFIAMKTIF